MSDEEMVKWALAQMGCEPDCATRDDERARMSTVIAGVRGQITLDRLSASRYVAGQSGT